VAKHCKCQVCLKSIAYGTDLPRKTLPREVGNFGLRGSVSARLAGTVAVNVTQVMVSSNSLETGAGDRLLPAAAVRWKCGTREAFSKAVLSPSFPPLHTGANSAGVRGDLIKLLWHDGEGMCLFKKRLDRGKFVWPMATSGVVSLTRAQLSMLCEGIDWRQPVRTWQPLIAI